MSNAQANGAGRVCFSDVARAHWRWDRTGDPDCSTATARKAQYDRMLAAFEQTVDTRASVKARVLDSYWCSKEASGVVLVEVTPEPSRSPVAAAVKRLGLWHPIPEYRLFRESDWVTVEYPKLANLLHECDVLAIKARWALEGLHQAVVMPWLMAVEEHILGYIERDYLRAKRHDALDPDGHDATSFHNAVLRELNRIEDYYQQAGVKRARLHFVTAMLVFGIPIVVLAALALAGALAPFGLLRLHDESTRRLYGAMAAGAVGAIVSVLMRMSGVAGDFKIDHELGSAGVKKLGALRPLVGAVSGVVVALLVQTTLVASQSGSVKIAFFVVVAFLAGFSERWTKVMLSEAMRTVGKADAEEPPATTVSPGRPAHG